MKNKGDLWKTLWFLNAMLGLVLASTSSGIVIVIYIFECFALTFFLAYLSTRSNWNQVPGRKRWWIRALIVASPLLLLFTTFWIFALMDIFIIWPMKHRL